MNSQTVGNIVFDANTGYTLSGGSLNFAASGSIAANSNATIGSTITGSNLTTLGSATLFLTGTNTYTGNTYVNGGVLSFAASAFSLSSTTNNKIYFGSAGTLQWNGNTTDISANLGTLASTSVATLDTNGNNVVFSKTLPLSHAGTLIKTGLGQLTLASQALWISNENGYGVCQNFQMTAGTVSEASTLSVGGYYGTNSGTATISGGLFTATGGVAMNIYAYSSTAVLNINGGTLKTAPPAVRSACTSAPASPARTPRST